MERKKMDMMGLRKSKKMEVINLAMILKRNESGKKVMVIIPTLTLKRKSKLDKMRKKGTKSAIMKTKAAENTFKLCTERKEELIKVVYGSLPF
jgi:hypothetical protein